MKSADSLLKSRITDEGGRLAALDRYGLRKAQGRSVEGLQRMTDLIADLMDAPFCSVSVIADEAQHFAAVTGGAHGLTDRSEAVCDRTIGQHGPLLVDDLAASEFALASFVTDERAFRSYAGVPLTTPDGYNLGALCVIDRQTRQFTPREVSLLERFAALVMEQLELRTMAHQDYLTGTASRRAFIERAEAELRRARTGGEAAALIVFDLDRFKAVNDLFGHGAGDGVLRATTAAVMETLRPGDVIGRLGGEEFAVLLPGCSAGEAMACAERYRAAIAAVDRKDLPQVTASLGVAMSDGHDGVEPWIAAADEALYAAKRGGRDRVEAAV